MAGELLRIFEILVAEELRRIRNSSGRGITELPRIRNGVPIFALNLSQFVPLLLLTSRTVTEGFEKKFLFFNLKCHMDAAN